MYSVVPSNEIEFTAIAFFSVSTYFSLASNLQPVLTIFFKNIFEIFAITLPGLVENAQGFPKSFKRKRLIPKDVMII